MPPLPDTRSAGRALRSALAFLLVFAASLLLGVQCGPTQVDSDGDTIPDAYDNCRTVANPSQRNSVRSASEVCVGAVSVDGTTAGAFQYGTCTNDPDARCLSDRDCTVGDACDCDLDGSGYCNVSDFNLFLADYTTGVPSGNGSDLDENGVVDANDFARFEPLFAEGLGGPGPALSDVVDVNLQPAACYDEKWPRRLWASEGRIPDGDDILDCSTAGNDLPIPGLIFDLLPAAAATRDALEDAMAADKNNPTDALIRAESGVNAPICPNAAFSIASKVAPRACDAHDLCLDHCGTKFDDCNRQFYRDLFNTCEALSGNERAFCETACVTFATLYASAIATAAAGGAFTPILAPPAADDVDPPAQVDYERDLYNCQCGPALCETTADCIPQRTTPHGLACDSGYCVQSWRNVGCSQDAECPDGYRCDTSSGDCWWDVRNLPSLVGAAPPVCGDGVCQPGIESCQASACPEDCGDPSAPVVAGDGRCALDDACLLDRDCAEGACLHGTCQRLADDSVCSAPDECASDSCDVLTRHCKSGCLVDQDCGTGVCSLFQCVDPLPLGGICDAHTDCESGNCFAGFCAPVCGDDVCEGTELCGAVDSGLECNSDCGLCPNGTACASNAVCESGVCNAPICIDAGSVAPGGTCTTSGACSSGSCIAGFCAGSCGDGYCTAVPNAETCYANSCQTDCGACPNGTPCTLNADCSSGRCLGLVCAAQTFCGDFSCNGSETCSTCAFDCGDCCAPAGNICLVGSDCCSGSCSFFTCR